jgi:hypothetical protein
MREVPVKRGATVFAVLVGLLLLSPSVASAASVQARFDPIAPQAGPFPSDRFTVPDSSQNTGLRVALPKPDCAIRPSDCADLDVINELDGFNLQPRLSIPFDGPIDVASVTSDSVFLVSLGSTLPGGEPGGRIVGINQVVWDTFTNTLHVESDELLDQHTGYVLLVTKNVLGEDGKEVKAAKAFLQFVDESNSGSTGDPALDAYRARLREALAQIDAAGVKPLGQVVAASIFTTESATAVMEKIRDQLEAATPAPADFLLGSSGERTVFPFADVASIDFKRQLTTAPTFLTRQVALGADGLDLIPGAVGTIALGKYSSPDYQTPAGVIPAVGTLTGTPAVQETNEVYFNLFLPSGPEPPGGWPVVIAGHGGGVGGKNLGSNPVESAARLAEHGLATIAINGAAFGGGPEGTLTVTKKDGSNPVTLPAGGRTVDLNGDGVFDQPPGTVPEGSYPELDGSEAIVFLRDGFRQTVVDWMQLVREIEVGMDVDGDSAPDLDPARIYYFGSSTGGVSGTSLVALDPDVRAGVLNTAGGSIIDWARLIQFAGRPLVGRLLASRTPSLANCGGVPPACADPIPPNPFPFNENLPLRNRQPVVNAVPGAIAIQEHFERIEWAGQSADPVAYSPHLRKAPLAGVPAKRVLFTFAQGDVLTRNTTTATILRAGDLKDRTTFFRAFDAYFPSTPSAAAVHEFPFTFTPAGKPFALAIQETIATFLASDGLVTVDPDGVGQLFETPLIGPLPGEP